MSTYHEPVLAEETLSLLITDREGTYVDGTVGGGGHAEKICQCLGSRGRLIGIDADADAIEESGRRLERFAPRVTLIRGNFRNIKSELKSLGTPKVDGILLDLGVSSHQIDLAERGFSFRADGKLDMRMDDRRVLSAHDVLNAYPQEKLEEILREYGEERAAGRIARAIVQARPVATAGELNGVIERCVGGKFLTKSLARVYQAIRIEVNGELESLREALAAVPDILIPGGRCIVIAYHSLEDRIVKEYFRGEAADSDSIASQVHPGYAAGAGAGDPDEETRHGGRGRNCAQRACPERKTQGGGTSLNGAVGGHGGKDYGKDSR